MHLSNYLRAGALGRSWIGDVLIPPLYVARKSKRIAHYAIPVSNPGVGTEYCTSAYIVPTQHDARTEFEDAITRGCCVESRGEQ